MSQNIDSESRELEENLLTILTYKSFYQKNTDTKLL